MTALEVLAQGCVIPATPLALTQARTFDEQAQRVLMRYYLDAGAGGIATAVHTTQFEIRKPEIALFEPVLRLVVQEVETYCQRVGRAVVKVAGVCGPIEQALREAELARSLGYDAVLLSPGGLAAYDEEYLLERTRQVAQVMPVIGFYLQKAVGGRYLGYPYWQALCAIDNVVAIKCACFNRYDTIEVVRAAALSPRAEQIALYTGNDDNIIIDLLTEYSFTHKGNIYTKRFVGGLLGHWTVWTQAVVTLFNRLRDQVESGQVSPEWLTLAAEVTDSNAAVFDTAHGYAGCIPGVHEVLRRQGLLSGTWCLNPDEVLSPGQAQEIDRVSAMYPHLTDDDFVAANLERWRREA